MNVPSSNSQGTETSETDTTINRKRAFSEEITAPVEGKAVDLTSVNDPVFASGTMGKGIAIIPRLGKIYAPIDGVVTVTSDSNHAYGIQSEKGAEILLHIGIDTVKMAGDGFKTYIKQGQKLKKGDLLGEFDMAKIKEAGFDSTVMMIVTNSFEYLEINSIKDSDIKVGDKALTLIQSESK